jgi:fructose-bisphosphate aldolase class I
MNVEQYDRMKNGAGFIAALDQSGGSTPKALALYGIDEAIYSSQDEMFLLMHQMRARIITSPVFSSERILGAILFEMTMERLIEGIPSAEYLWNRKHIVPFLKIDNGLLPTAHGVALMKPIPELASRLEKARRFGIFGTKERSVIYEPDFAGISSCVDQQFEIADEVLDSDLVPIIEPEVDIKSNEKRYIEEILKSALIAGLDSLESNQNVMLKLTLPEEANFYADIVRHPRVLRVVALSGGYSQEHAVELLARNEGLIASFSRALTENLHHDQSDEQFNATLERSIENIYLASTQKISI